MSCGSRLESRALSIVRDHELTIGCGNDLFDLLSHRTKGLVNCHVANDGAADRSPKHGLDVRVSSKLRRNKNMFCDHIVQHGESRAVSFVRFDTHSLHNGTPHRDATVSGLEKLALEADQEKQSLERVRVFSSASC